MRDYILRKRFGYLDLLIIYILVQILDGIVEAIF